MSEFDDEYAVTLSAGYDSNSILSYIKRAQPGSRVEAFSIGGQRGINETDDARTIARMYSNVSFHSSLVGPHTLEYLDEIVHMLEGSVPIRFFTAGCLTALLTMFFSIITGSIHTRWRPMLYLRKTH